MSNTFRYCLIGILIVVAWLVVASGALTFARPVPTTSAQGSQRHDEPANQSRQHSIVGDPQLTVLQLNAILAAYGSPLAGQGQLVYDLGRKYTISSDYALAIWLHESALGKSPLAQETLNPGNIRCMEGLACDQGFARMGSWAEGMERWYRLIRYGYVEGRVTQGIVGHNCTTIEQIIQVYAPKADSNDPDGYIQIVIRTVETWRSGKVVA
ncbi:glucosaminidase domain-containing protein [Ktedonospora formicarum]|uniref:Mannosyl-glycoprotein endo-beta-N-acetylglucosamidase-like domain-containing protein n=1 Tax=Ktedonospora formicarum TaxID=2778364 RepID=A0A8J3I6U0_9CHLR|nr:glucosaminidase domain-containing protein [Ktedonospora formicarum]GHO51422.1 hypothetical protein KSX_95850 [Ktedonospora formicarum]